jgi:hypothetical protein
MPRPESADFADYTDKKTYRKGGVVMTAPLSDLNAFLLLIESQ